MQKETDPGKRIDSVWLFVAVDSDGDEGLPAFAGAGGVVMPMVASDERRRDMLLEIARAEIAHGRLPGGHIEVRKFTGYTVEQVIG